MTHVAYLTTFGRPCRSSRLKFSADIKARIPPCYSSCFILLKAAYTPKIAFCIDSKRSFLRPIRRSPEHCNSRGDSPSNMRILKSSRAPFRQRVDNQQPVCSGSNTSRQLKNKSSVTTRTSSRMTRIKYKHHHRARRQVRLRSLKYCKESGSSKPQSGRTPANSTYDSALTLDTIVIPGQPILTWLPSVWLEDTLLCSFPPGFLPTHLIAQLAPPHDPDCPICCAPLDILPPYYNDPAVRAQINQGLDNITPGVARHTSCGRTVHQHCFKQWVHTCYYSSDRVTCPMCRGLLWQREREEVVVRAAQTVDPWLGSDPRVTARWYWRLWGGWCLQCTMLKVLLAGVALLVMFGGYYGVAVCTCWMFGVKGLIVLLFMLGLLGMILCVVAILQRLLRLI